jgi:hypothetical protein
MTERKRPAVPEGLSAAKAAIWRRLTDAYDFTAAETYAFEMYLRHEDRADRLEEEGETKPAHDARTIAFRYWRTLKFGAGGSSRRIGRRPDTGWSQQRGAHAL